MKINLPMKVQFIGKVDKFDIIKDELKLIQDPDEQIIYLINKKVECLQKKDGWEIELGLSLPEKIQLEIDKRKEIMKIKKQIVNKPKIIKSLAKRIFISHGRSHEWRKVQAYIEKTLEYETLELAQEPNLGRTVLQKLSEESDKCGYAVIVMTGDDIVDGDLNRARENVIHEIGYFQGKFGLKNICLLYEEGTNIPSNIKGLVYIPFAKDKVENTFGDLTKELNAFMKSK
ncbi:MAG: nucleotide-binding protein [Ignavibacteriae bacterium]|nr:nucleotide-binding protein [Ignavibacteriota bacterium]